MDDSQEIDAERRVTRELQTLLGAAQPPPWVRAQLLCAAEERASALRRRRAARRWLAPLAAAAAAVLALAVLWPTPRATRAYDVADLDQSGRVDVWDAYLLARATERDEALPAALDLDGDGAVTRHDADALAQRAVEVIR